MKPLIFIKTLWPLTLLYVKSKKTCHLLQKLYLYESQEELEKEEKRIMFKRKYGSIANL